MEECYKEAFVEVLDILKHTNLEIVKKIPKNFQDFLVENKSKNYKSKIDFNNPLWQDTIKTETQDVLALIYRDYLVSKEKRKELIELEEKELSEKYSYDKLFLRKKDNFNNIQETAIEKEQSLVVINNKWYSKIIMFFKNLIQK